MAGNKGRNTVSHRGYPCGYCKLPNRADGHDACLGEIPGVMNACCGHGDIKCAYIQYPAEDAPDAVGEWCCLCVPGRSSASGKCPRCGDERTFRIAGEEAMLFLDRKGIARLLTESIEPSYG